MSTQSKNDIHHPDPKYSIVTIHIIKPTSQTTVTQALKDTKWSATMTGELDAPFQKST